MKLLKKCLVGFALLVVAAALLLWFLPARWMLPWIEPQLRGMQLQQVSGSIWNGRAGAVVSVDKKSLGQLHWQLSRRSLFGHAQMQWQFSGPDLSFSAALARLSADQTDVRNLSLSATSAALGQQLTTPWGQPRGELQLSIPHALLWAGWPMQMDAQATWHHAVMHTAHGDVALGDVHATAQARGGMISAQLHDGGDGPLQIGGELQLSPLGWRLDVTLRPRQTDPMLRRWLATLAAPAADGNTHIQHHGGLASSAPTPTH
ncbi:type II secretion system protein N [Rhodanobacter sp. AS-Z3]|uniref:type II secretion system protein N n=1 Tax=Rhodanobacter sp. AS-Z3 TaxID=3031330 RepID=UPI00247B101A|nr:type II secretion system protein N [Rhodanobacter sp. AS-Z3]WEN16294.1 type II secretion system protein N [Rhodanobacter sp. AS-Z3]